MDIHVEAQKWCQSEPDYYAETPMLQAGITILDVSAVFGHKESIIISTSLSLDIRNLTACILLAFTNTYNILQIH